MNRIKSIFFIMIICALFFALTGCEKNQEIDNTIIANNSKIDETIIEKNEVAETNNTTNKKELSNDEIYGELITNYEKALKEYELDDIEADEKINDKYGIKDTILLMHIARYAENGVKLTKEFYDIDKNGIDELILGADNAIGVIYSFDTNTNKPVFIFALDTLERGFASIYDNGVIYSGGAGGAALHIYEFGKISENGTSYELLEKVEEEYKEDSEIPEYRDPATEEKLEYKSFDEVTDKYISNAKEVKIFE